MWEIRKCSLQSRLELTTTRVTLHESSTLKSIHSIIRHRDVTHLVEMAIRPMRPNKNKWKWYASDIFLVDFVVPWRTWRPWRRRHRTKTTLWGKNLWLNSIENIIRVECRRLRDLLDLDESSKSIQQLERAHQPISSISIEKGKRERANPKIGDNRESCSMIENSQTRHQHVLAEEILRVMDLGELDVFVVWKASRPPIKIIGSNWRKNIVMTMTSILSLIPIPYF